jgi:hypothetical protein
MGDGFFLDPNKIENETNYLAKAAGSLEAANVALKSATMSEGTLTILGQLPELGNGNSLPDEYNNALKTLTDKVDEAVGFIMQSITTIENDIMAQYKDIDANNMRSIIFAGSGLSPDGSALSGSQSSLDHTNYSESFEPYSGK